jgi:RimJ/RimL family protein N-acetyltransferase
MHDIVIRELIPMKNKKDAYLLLPAFLAIWNDPENLKFLSFTQKPFMESTVKNWFSDHLNMGGHFYVAMGKDDTICGIAVAKINQIEGFELIGIGVLSGSKKQGIGTNLLSHVISVAINSGFKAIETLVFTDNIAMMRLLLSLSFIPISMDYNRRCDGADILRMKRML